MKKLLLFMLLNIFLVIPAFAWNASGHKVIAQIAYSRLTPKAKQMVDNWSKVGDAKYPAKSRFLYDSVWPDLLVARDDVTAFSGWHFINYPFSPDGTPVKPYNPENVVWAINQSEHVLLSPKANLREKAIFLRFLEHFVGDAHQPLHCVSRFTKALPDGDRGGNLVPIKDRDATNLHAYWDLGVGLLRTYNKNLAAKIVQDYPPNYFGNKANDLNPEDWAQESFSIAKSFVYNVTINTKPSAAYNAQGKKIVEQRLALAGYRLANLLNTIAKEEGK